MNHVAEKSRLTPIKLTIGALIQICLLHSGALITSLAMAEPVVTSQNGLACAGTRAGTFLGCTANDFTTTVILTNSGADSCTDGDYFFLDAQVTMTSGGPRRYNVGFFAGEADNDPQANNAAKLCSVATFPTSPAPWFQGNGPNTCGDFDSNSTSSPTVRQLRVQCVDNGLGILQVPYAVTWEQNDNATCSGAANVQAGTQSKCVGGTATISNVVVKPRPAAHYRFDESTWRGTAGEVADSSDNALNGTAQGGAITAATTPAIAGDPGTCRYGVFDGQNDQVAIPHNAQLQSTTALTYAAWIYPRNLSGGIHQVMSKSVHGGGGGRAQMGIFSEGGALKGRAMALNGDSTTGWEVQTSLPALDTWTHVALVFAGDRLTLYVNGAEANSRTFASTTLRTNTDPFTIGNDYGRDYYFNGFIDETRVYTSALNAAQVGAVMLETHPCPTGPMGACSVVFPSPLQNSDLAGSITFNWNAQALADPDGALETGNLVYNSAGAATCGTAHCLSKGVASTPAVVPEFPSNTSATDVSTPLLGNTITLGQGGITDYRTVTMNWRLFGSHLVDGGASSVYRIKTLNLNAGTATLRGGADYWIETLNFNGSIVFNVAGQGTARLFIKNAVSGSWGSELNPGGTPDQLLMVPYGNFTWNTNETDFNALVYSSGNITIGSNMTLAGALASPGQISLGSGSRITYDQQAVTDVDDRGLCSGIVDEGLHHLRILHSGQGLTCAPAQVTIQACKNADCSELYTGAVTASLSPAGWVGGDTIAINGGAATANLRYTLPAVVTLGATANSPSATDATRCFVGATENCDMSFSEAGFIFDVPTLTSNKTSGDITITAVKTSDSGETCAPAFSGSRTVNFWSTYANPNSGSAVTSVNGTNVATGGPGTGIDLTFDAAAQAKITVHYPDAGLMRLDARYTGSGEEAGLVLSGNDQFVVKPVGLCVLSADANSGCASGDHTCSAFTAAGADFNLTVRAVAWESDTDTDLCSGNAATPNFRLNAVGLGSTLVSPAAAGGGQAGGVGISSTDFIAADNGDKTLSQSISEVGVFQFTATPPAGAYFGETVAGGVSVNIGRFYPDHFDVAHTATPACNATFTYAGLTGSKAGQPFGVSGTVTARNAIGGITTNYEGDFAKLGTGDITASPRLGAAPAAGALTWSVNTLGFDDGDGTFGVLAAQYAFSAEGAPQNMHLRITATDSDGATGTDDDTTKAVPYRLGRLRLQNAFGSELMDLDVPLQAESFTTGGFYARDADDGCTTLIPANLSCNGGACTNVAVGGGTASASWTPLIGGDAGLSFGAPGAENTGNIDILTAIGASHPWLLFDWDGNGVHNNEATGRATFGIYKGSPRHIYLRERY